MHNVLCVGALTEDTIYKLENSPTQPGKYLATESMRFTSGMASSAAICITSLGGKSDVWSSVGLDSVGQKLLADLERLGIGTENIRKVPGASSATAAIGIGPNGETVVLARYDGLLIVPPTTVPSISPTRYAVVLTDVRWPGAAERALRLARQVGIPGILDLDMGPHAVLAKLAPLASHLIASRAAAAVVTGENDPRQAAVKMFSINPAFVCVTAGEEGSFWLSQSQPEVSHAPAFPVKAVSTLGAGDAFHGAFALRLAERAGLAGCLLFASAAAAVKCSRFGGTETMPHRNEVDKLLQIHRC